MLEEEEFLMTGRDLMNELEVQCGQYRLSVEVVDESKRSVYGPFPLIEDEYRCTLTNDRDGVTMAFPFVCGKDSFFISRNADFGVRTGDDSPFNRCIKMLVSFVSDTLDESYRDFHDFCGKLGREAKVQDVYGDTVLNAPMLEAWKELNEYREMVQNNLPFDKLQYALYYGVRDMDGERLVVPAAFPNHDRHVALLLQVMLDEVKYTGHDGKTHSVKMEELNPEIGRWLSEEVRLLIPLDVSDEESIDEEPVEMGR